MNRRTKRRMLENTVRFAEFVLDFGRFQLFRAGDPVRLECLPLQVLMLLVEHHRQLVTREQIADKLWGKDVFVDFEQGINTAIRKIRAALSDDSERPRYLQTVVGRGYRFLAETTDDVAANSETTQKFSISAEEFGQAIVAAAGLDLNDHKTSKKNTDKPKVGAGGSSG